MTYEETSETANIRFCFAIRLPVAELFFLALASALGLSERCRTNSVSPTYVERSTAQRSTCVHTPCAERWRHTPTVATALVSAIICPPARVEHDHARRPQPDFWCPSSGSRLRHSPWRAAVAVVPQSSPPRSSLYRPPPAPMELEIWLPAPPTRSLAAVRLAAAWTSYCGSHALCRRDRTLYERTARHPPFS